jgi:hypothetical protein
MRPLDGAWRKATRSSGNNGCVEARFVDGTVEVRDSKNPAGGVLRFTPHEWECFSAGMDAGEFKLPE